jgi:hypothetical protein
VFDTQPGASAALSEQDQSYRRRKSPSGRRRAEWATRARRSAPTPAFQTPSRTPLNRSALRDALEYHPGRSGVLTAPRVYATPSRIVVIPAPPNGQVSGPDGFHGASHAGSWIRISEMGSACCKSRYRDARGPKSVRLVHAFGRKRPPREFSTRWGERRSSTNGIGGFANG